MDPTLWSSIVTAVVAVVAIVTTSRASARAVKAARDAAAGADAAAQRAEVWRRFEWAVAAVTEPGNPARAAAGWVILRSLPVTPGRTSRSGR